MTEQPPNRHDCRAEVRDELMARLATPMTVIKGNAHLVRRWIRTGDESDRDMVLARLVVIETMVDRVVATICDLDGPPDGQLSPGSRNPLRDTA